MGCDIHGYVETNEYGWWQDCINIKAIVGRNYGMFALLFGVRNDASFIPVAPDRGLPEDASDHVKSDSAYWDADGHSHTWITWKEIQGINWNEQGTQMANRIFCYRPGEEQSYSSFGWASYLSEEDYAALNRGETIEGFDPFTQSPVLYRREVQKVSDALSDDWQLLFDLMKQLDERFRRNDRDIVESSRVPVLSSEDDSKVRLVVWFDN